MSTFNLLGKAGLGFIAFATILTLYPCVIRWQVQSSLAYSASLDFLYAERTIMDSVPSSSAIIYSAEEREEIVHDDLKIWVTLDL